MSCIFLYFQTLVAGQGLNDDMWHTLRFSRRAASLKFQIDDEPAVRGKSMNNSFYKFSIQHRFSISYEPSSYVYRD